MKTTVRNDDGVSMIYKRIQMAGVAKHKRTCMVTWMNEASICLDSPLVYYVKQKDIGDIDHRLPVIQIMKY